MRPYKAIVFDFDMTLADSSHVIVDLLNDCAEQFGFPRKTYGETLPVVGNTHEIMLSHVTGVTDPARILEMREYYRQLCLSEMPQRISFFPGAEACLKQIFEKKIQAGILSLKLRAALEASLEKYNLSRYFNVVLGCEDVPAPKPDPGGLRKAMAAMKIADAKDLLYVGDSLIDEKAAASAGTDFAAMLLGGTGREEFDPALVRHMYASLDELRLDVAGLPDCGDQQ